MDSSKTAQTLLISRLLLILTHLPRLSKSNHLIHWIDVQIYQLIQEGFSSFYEKTENRQMNAEQANLRKIFWKKFHLLLKIWSFLIKRMVRPVFLLIQENIYVSKWEVYFN